MREFLDKAASAYYEGAPIIPDSEFDHLAEIYGYKTVGYSVTDGVPHMYKMYSLQKFFDLKDAPSNLGEYILTPKLDGAAISILYVGGQLAMALTRGDGNIGRDVTAKVATLVPTSLSCDTTMFITGEVVVPESVPNARNFASGSLGLKDDEAGLAEFKTRPINFIAYNVQGPNLSEKTWIQLMTSLRAQGFNTVDTVPVDSVYPTDGSVYRLNSIEQFERMGYTSHHPRGAFALKEQKDGVVTTLRDVIWQVGKSGVVSPVAILDPIEIGGATVAKATLHNIEYIRALDLQIGCKVEVIRSGEIIPRVVKKVIDIDL